MRALYRLALLLIPLIPATASAADNSSPYVEITVRGIEEVAPPLNRLADAIEKLSQSDTLSDEDQHKIIAIIGELKVLSGELDSTLQKTKQNITQAQSEIAASIRQLIIVSLLGLTVTIILVCAAVFYLFRLQIAPLINTTSTTVTKIADAIENLSATAEFIAEKGATGNRRFARKQILIR